MRYWYLSFAIAILFSCQRIETGKTLSKDQINYIRQLGLLDRDEKIIKFYSEYKKKVAGNFFTDKRMAVYWIDENDSSKNHKAFAYYPDIIAIDTNYMRGALTFAPYMQVTKKDGTQFKVYVEGSQAEIRSFFEEAITKWKSTKNQKDE